ncbi:hypothetical protein EX30DRAFT_349007 [Ascodesmis nigricans]|uniref:DUF7909 domain-containing protein n=1 Tax=Ascodesmis nigricans TaxID=341454 RepID=A0A4S2MWU3_9PEZI|nr:hypothetical protein EX30DRAFT_349007 [Ascodesmis nigricans]
MRSFQILGIFAALTAPILGSPTPSGPCTPSLLPISDIPQNFYVRVVIPGNEDLTNRMMNFQPSGGSDQHPYLDPAGHFTGTNTLVSNVITNTAISTGATIRLCLGGNPDSKDGTTKLFFTKRNTDPRAIFDVWGGCGENNYEFKLRDGAVVCVRKASGNKWEFRYTPAGNTKDADCIKAKIVPVFA